MGNKQFEHFLGTHCAPTLVGLKAASLLAVHKTDREDFLQLLEEYKPCFHCKGISVLQLGENESSILMLFFRPEILARQLQRSLASQLLQQFGYPAEGRLVEKLSFLQERIRIKDSFPHEIGLFLGYPPEDVHGFIENKGREFAYSGYWKVYANEERTRELFQLYTECTREFCTQLQTGSSICDLLHAF